MTLGTDQTATNWLWLELTPPANRSAIEYLTRAIERYGSKPWNPDHVPPTVLGINPRALTPDLSAAAHHHHLSIRPLSVLPPNLIALSCVGANGDRQELAP